MLVHSPKFLSICAAAGLALTSGTSFAQITLISPTVNNGSFETNTAGAGGGKVDPMTAVTSSGPASATVNVPYWAETAAFNDTGVQSGAGLNEDGIYGAFEQPGASIFNLVTSRPIVAGDVYTLTFYGRDTNGGVATQSNTFSFFTQAPPTSSPYSFLPSAIVESVPFVLSNAAALAMYTETYTAVAGDAGNDIGIELTDSGADYNGLDNFNLTVTPAAIVPEPSTYALLAVAVGGLLFLRRRALA